MRNRTFQAVAVVTRNECAAPVALAVSSASLAASAHALLGCGGYVHSVRTTGALRHE